MSSPNKHDFLSVMVFKLNSQWYALRTACLKEISVLKPVHRIPHRQDPILRGLVNLDGQLQLCISLKHLLELNLGSLSEDTQQPIESQRLVAMAKNEEVWVFLVDEIDRVYLWDSSSFQEKEEDEAMQTTYFKGRFLDGDRFIDLIDEEALFNRLQLIVKDIK